jgi:hypothetical protein
MVASPARILTRQENKHNSADPTRTTQGTVSGGALRLRADPRAGAVRHPPYTVDVTGLLRRGENRIRIEVANLALNHMSGRPLPDDSALHARYGKRFDPQDMHLVRPIPAGLMGPIRLVATARTRP